MLVESTRRRHSSAAEIERVRVILQVLEVEQGGCKNIRVIEKSKPSNCKRLYLALRPDSVTLQLVVARHTKKTRSRE